MGSYLSKPRRPPAPGALPSPTPPPSRKHRLHRERGAPSSGFVMAPRGHYQIQQTRHSSVGLLPMAYWGGCHKKAVLSSPGGPGSLQITPPDRRGMPCPFPELILKSTLSSPSGDTPEPCAQDSAKSDIHEKTLEEEDQTFCDGRDNDDSIGSGHSAFRPLVVNGIPTAFVPKPGPLRRSLASQSMYRGGMLSSSHHRNAVSSSYSSMQGISPLWEGSSLLSSPCTGPASCCSQPPGRPAKMKRCEEPYHHLRSSSPLVAGRESHLKTRKQQESSPADNSEQHSPRRRKIPLLHPRKGNPLTLPLGPQPGYLVTAEDLDMENTTRLEWFNQFLEDKTNAAPNPLMHTAASTLLSTTPAFLAAPTTNQLLERQNTPGLQSFAGPVVVATATDTSPLNAPSQPAPFSSPGLMPDNHSDSKALGINTASLPGSTPVFGGMFKPVLQHSAPAPGLSAPCSNLSDGPAATPAPGASLGVGPFGFMAPSFPVDEGSKIPAVRKRLQARRHHPRKK